MFCFVVLFSFRNNKFEPFKYQIKWYFQTNNVKCDFGTPKPEW